MNGFEKFTSITSERGEKTQFLCSIIYERPHKKMFNLLFQGQALQFLSGLGTILIFEIIKNEIEILI